MKHYLAVLSLIFFSTFLQAQNCNQGGTRIMIKKSLMVEIYAVDYQFHGGFCILKDGSRLEGGFCYRPYKSNLHGSVSPRLKEYPGHVFEFKLDGSQDVERIPMRKIQYLQMAGRDSELEPGDSTNFYYIDECNALMRLIYDKEIKVYDDIMITDEFNKSQTHKWECLSPSGRAPKTIFTDVFVSNPESSVDNRGYLMAMRHTEKYCVEKNGVRTKVNSFKKLKRSVELPVQLQTIRNTIGKKNFVDYSFMLKYTLANDKEDFLFFFKDAEIEFENGEKENVKAYINPINASQDIYDNYVFLLKNDQLEMVSVSEIKRLTFADTEYSKIVDSFSRKEFMARLLEKEGVNYAFVPKFLFNGNFFNYSDEELFYIYKKGRKNKYKLDLSSGEGIVKDVKTFFKGD